MGQLPEGGPHAAIPRQDGSLQPVTVDANDPWSMVVRDERNSDVTSRVTFSLDDRGTKVGSMDGADPWPLKGEKVVRPPAGVYNPQGPPKPFGSSDHRQPGP